MIMKSIVCRLIHSHSFSRSLISSSSSCLIANGRLLSTESNRVDEPFKVEEAETVKAPPPLSEKLLVLGGSGFVGSHVCQEALNQGLSVASLSRSGRSSIRESWADRVEWHQGSLLLPDSFKDVLDDVTAVISCVGGFGSNSHMYKINGTANINAIRTAAEKGVKRFVYISAADFGLANYVLQGYYEGKRDAEAELLSKYMYGGVILRPGFIYGTRQVGSMKVPLGVIGSPLEMILQHAKPLNKAPFVGPLFTPPVNVTSVANVAVRAATDPAFPPGIVDVYGILRYKSNVNECRRLNNKNKLWHVSNAFADVTQLAFLDFSYNNLSGTIPNVQLLTRRCWKSIDLSCWFEERLLWDNADAQSPLSCIQSLVAYAQLVSSLGCSSGGGKGAINKYFSIIMNNLAMESALEILKRFQVATNNFSLGNVYIGQLKDGNCCRLRDPILNRSRDDKFSSSQMSY